MTGAASGVQQRHLGRPCLGSEHQHLAMSVRELIPPGPRGLGGSRAPGEGFAP